MLVRQWISRLWQTPFTLTGLVWTYVGVVLVYAYGAVAGSLNGDDVIQIQSVSQDALTFIPQGRWAHFIVFEWIQNANPGALFYASAGLACLVLTGWIGFRLIGFQKGVAQYAFLLLSCVSIYYGVLFDFSCSRFSYPLGGLAAVGGLWWFFNGRPWAGLLAMAVAPAFYQAASQLAATLLICKALFDLLSGKNPKESLKSFAFGVAGLMSSLVLYYLITRIGYSVLGLELNERMTLSARAAFENSSLIHFLLTTHSFPFFSGDELDVYRTWRWLWPLTAIALLFLGTIFRLCWKQGQLRRAVLVGFLVALGFFAPFALTFAGPHSEFPNRSLYGLAVLHGFWVAFVLDQAAQKKEHSRWFRFAGAAMLVAGALFLFESGAQINSYAYDRNLATQADLFATNRIVARIEDVAANEKRELGHPQPLVVIYDEAPVPPASPRGNARTARQVPWAKEWIFRFVDPRFMPNKAAESEARQAARGRKGWPSHESVFFLKDGTAVVVINQSP